MSDVKETKEQRQRRERNLQAALVGPWDDRISGGKGDRLSPNDVPHDALIEGAQHELEHTNDPHMAIEIALDHLSEDPTYYKKLKKLEKVAAQEEYFHGSPHQLTHLREGSWVTPYQEDAAVFGAPWGSDDLHYKGGPDGRPPKKLRFKRPPPKDHPVYVYSVKGPTKGARTNKGGEYEWNRQTTSELPATLVKVLPSWHKAFLKGPMEKAAAGLWDNIHAKRARIAMGSKERMRKPGSEGAPTAKAIRESKEKEAGHVSSFRALIEKLAQVEYQGKQFPGYNQPIPSDKKDKKMMVLAKDGDAVKLVHFGQKGYKHNYTPEAKANYLKRSAGIRDKSGRLTKDNKLSPNYWARRVLWPKGETGNGSNGPIDTDQ